MNKTKAVFLTILSVVIIGACLCVMIDKYQPVVIENANAKELIKEPINIIPINPVNLIGIKRTNAINLIKSKTLNNGKYELNRLSKIEKYSVIDMIKDNIVGKRIDITNDAYYFRDGKVIFKMDYFINNLQ